MAQEKEEILIEIVVSNEAASKAIYENQQSIERLKKTQEDLTKARKAGTITEEEYSKKSTAVKVAIDSQKESIRQNEKELRNNIKTQKDNNDSLAAMRAQLSNNVKAFDSLSKAERESAKGQELQKSIADTVEQLNEAEQATGRFQRQVGNYPQAMAGAGGGINQVTGFLGKMSDQVGIVSPRMGAMISQFGGFAAKSANVASDVGHMNTNLAQSGEAMGAVEGFAGKASGSLNNLSNTANVAGKASTGAFSSIAQGAKALGTVFLTPPIIVIAAVIGAIVAAFKLLQLGFEKNDAASDKMAESLAILQPILDYVSKLAGAFAGAVAELVGYLAEGIATLVDFTAALFGVQAGFTEAANEAKKLVQAQDEIENSERDYIINSANRAKKRAELLAEVADKEKNNAEQRVAYLKDALALDEKELAEKQRIARLKFLVAVQEAKNTNDTNIETQKKQAQLLADAINAETAYFEGKKEINKKLSAAEKEMQSEQQANYEKWKQNHDEKLSKEKQAIRQLEDLVTQQIKDEYQRQIVAEQAKIKRVNEDLQFRLNNEKNLTDTARKAINQSIIENQNILDAKINELTEKSLDSSIKKEIDAKTKEYEAKIQLAEKGSQDELNVKQAKLLLERDALLLNDELTNVQRLAIEDKYNKDSQALTDANNINKYNAIQQQLNKEYELKVLNAENNGLFEDEKARLELEKAQANYDALMALDLDVKQSMYATQLDYELAVAKSKQGIIDAEQRVMDSEIKSREAFVSSMRSISNSLGSLLTMMAEDSYEAAQYAKALALVNIGIALAEGIAGVVKTAAKSTTWYEMAAAIATGVVSVASAIASANKAFKDTPNPPKPSEFNSSSKKQAFATGGLVVGSGSGTSDSIDARLSNGESVMNANSTSMFTPLLSALNQAGGGVGFGAAQVSNQLQGEDMLARAFAKGASMIPPNILTLKEFHEKNDRFLSLKEL